MQTTLSRRPDRPALAAAAALFLVYGAAASAADALKCDDRKIVTKLQSGYTPPASGMKFKFEDIREVGYGAPPKIAAATFEKSRYCQARIVLDSGVTDMAYYRLNVLKGGTVQDWVEPCFKMSNDKGMKDGCVDSRPAS
jgi:hypothetical protein